jgi:hypothetical protein
VFEEKRDGFLYRLTQYFDEDFNKKSLIKLFAAGIIGNVSAWLTALFAPQIFGDIVGLLGSLEEKFFYYLLVFPFFFAFLMSFSVCKFIFRKHDRALVSEDEFMSRYSAHTKSENIRRLFLISTMFGASNAILLVLAVIWFRET